MIRPNQPEAAAFAGMLAPSRVMEVLDIIEHIRPGIIPRPVRIGANRSVFTDEKRLSVAAF